MNSSIWFSVIKINVICTLICILLSYFIIFTKNTFTVWAKKNYSKIALKRWVLGARLFFVVLFLGSLFYILIPVAKDDLHLLKQGVSIDSLDYAVGEIKLTSRFSIFWFMHQSFSFIGDKDELQYSIYLDKTLIREGKCYEIYYLPNSKIVFNVKRIDCEKNE